LWCHGPSYKGIYEAWQRGVATRVNGLRAQMNATAAAVGVSAGQAWDDAQHNFRLVERGRGVHNVSYAFALLDQAHEQMNQARRDRGLGTLGRPWPEVAAGAQACLTCHQGVETRTGTFEGRRFDHAPHVNVAKLDCAACHRPHAERAPGEIVRFGGDGCLTCHHRNLEAAGPACMTCHQDVSARTVTSFRGEFSHEAHREVGLECATCHDPSRGDPRPPRSACMDCHVD
jgi:predicted CXXCH cytochrome family protein